MCKFRDLRADEIEVRIQSTKADELILLLYKDARVDMNILDETVGASNWQRLHYECKGNLFCQVGINCSMESPNGLANIGFKAEGGGIDHYQEWVWKSDCGVESNTEAQKGEASDSFKRACFNWGIGRELYTSPLIKVSAKYCNIKQSGSYYKCYDKFSVEKIIIENKQIVALAIWNETKNCRAFMWQKEEVK